MKKNKASQERESLFSVTMWGIADVHVPLFGIGWRNVVIDLCSVGPR